MGSCPRCREYSVTSSSHVFTNSENTNLQSFFLILFFLFCFSTRYIEVFRIGKKFQHNSSFLKTRNFSSLSTTSKMDRQLLHQKTHQKSSQKISVMKTKKLVFPEKTVCFGILIHILSWRQQKHQCLCFHYWDFWTNFCRNNRRSIFDFATFSLIIVKFFCRFGIHGKVWWIHT